MRLVACALVFAIASCNVERPVFRCATWENCGPGGACEPVEEACSFADESCTKTGRRFSALAPAPYNDQCVELRDDAAKGGLCAVDPTPGAPRCGDGRACLGNRCVSTLELEIGKLFACGRCALAPYAPGPLYCWGSLALGTFSPVLLAGLGYGACTSALQGTCPTECASCTPATQYDPQVCPSTCLGSEVSTEYTIGENHLCFTNGRTYCAGANGTSQLGKGSPDLVEYPNTLYMRLDAIFTKVSAGANHTCGRGGSDRVFCWGDNRAGQLTDGVFAGSVSADPQPVVAMGPVFPFEEGVQVPVDYIAASRDFTCAASRKDVRCWGTVPWGAGFVAGLPPGQITDFDVGQNHACAIKGDRVVCWGNNRDGQADPAMPSNDAPPTIVLEDEAIRVVTGAVHTCAITKTGAVWCWGQGMEGQLGDGEAPGPALVRDHPPAVGPIAAGDDVTCAIHADDRVRCWGKVLQVMGVAYEDFSICVR